MALLLADRFGDHMGDGWWIVIMVGMLVVWGLIALAVVWAVRSLVAPGRVDSSGTTAIEVLDRRLADGWISVEEYEERRRFLVAERGEETQ